MPNLPIARRSTAQLATKTTIAAASLFLLLVSSVLADAIDDRANELLHWVAQKTGYRAEHVRATVAFVEPRTIILIAYGVRKEDDPTPEAISDSATIFLPTWFELGKDDDILVHELTHVLPSYSTPTTPRSDAEQSRSGKRMRLSRPS